MTLFQSKFEYIVNHSKY